MHRAGTSASSLALALALALLAPTASAWELRASAPIAGEIALRDALVLSGEILGRAPGGVFGAPEAWRASFGRSLDVSYCEDVAGEQRPGQCARPPQETTGANLHIIRGGLLVRPLDEGESLLDLPVGVGAAGGLNLTLNRVVLGPSLFAAGPVNLSHPGGAFEVRPLGADAAIELRGNEGFRIYNGSGYTLTLTGAEGALIEAQGGILALTNGSSVTLTRAPGDVTIDGVPVFDLIRSVQAPERADLRGDLAAAFGPFTEVGALRNGVIAMRTNLTLLGEGEGERDGGDEGQGGGEFLLVRVGDATLRSENVTWLVQGNASYLVLGERFAREPGGETRPPYVVPVLLVGAALLLRPFVKREPSPRTAIHAQRVIRLGGLLVLAAAAGYVLAALLGADGLRPGLPGRERVRLLVAPLLLATLTLLFVAIPAESLARRLLSWRKRASEGILPTFVGLALALLFIAAFAGGLVALALRLVRL